ncbi:MAG: hypothetical protein WED15_01955 [Akkermansiaceae bacterium]
MHCFRSKAVLFRFQIAALLLCLKWLLIPATLGLLLYSLLVLDRDLTIIALLLGALIISVAILQRLLAARTRCPLCMTEVLATKRCAKHRGARKFLGSYRLRVASGILFKDSFLCPFCHEPTAMEVRDRCH